MMLHKLFFLCLIIFWPSTTMAAQISCAKHTDTVGVDVFLQAETFFTRRDGRKPDYQRAFQQYQKAAEIGHAEAHLRLGHLYAEKHFTNTPYDLGLAEKNLTFAATHNVADARFRLGNFYLQYKQPPKIGKAILWLNQAAFCGHPTAQFDLARLYLTKQINSEKIMPLLTRAAESGNRQAQEMLARFYLKGKKDIAEKNTKKMVFWAQKITKHKGAPVFWLEILAMHYEDSGDMGKAHMIWQRAARKNSAKARKHLSEHY